MVMVSRRKNFSTTWILLLEKFHIHVRQQEGWRCDTYAVVDVVDAVVAVHPLLKREIAPFRRRHCRRRSVVVVVVDDDDQCLVPSQSSHRRHS